MDKPIFKDLYKGKELEERINIQERYSVFNLKEWLINLYNFKKQDKVLDLGCGNGDGLLSFSPYFYTGLGVDISEELLQKAKKRKEDLKNNNVKFTCYDCNDFLVKNYKFDIIYSNFSFYYFNAEKVLENIYKMLALGGVVFIGGSPDENAPELSYLISKILNEDEIPLTYKKRFSDVRKYYSLFKQFFKNIQFYRFINTIKFPSVLYFLKYLKSTTLLQSLNKHKKSEFLNESRKILLKKKNFNLTKVVDVLRASNK